MVDGLGPHFLLTRNLTRWYLVLQCPRISSKCFWNVSLESKVIPRNLTRGYILSLSPYSFRTGSDFLARGDLENVMTLVFQDLVLFSIWHTTLPISVCTHPKVLLQIVHFYQEPIEQCHQRSGISSFVRGGDLVSH